MCGKAFFRIRAVLSPERSAPLPCSEFLLFCARIGRMAKKSCKGVRASDQTWCTGKLARRLLESSL
ncbi:hypothetical protein ACU4GD_19585, partial [Cupriavidus basilensis]